MIDALHVCLQGSLMIALMLVARPLVLSRLTPRERDVLWLLVIVRLAVPLPFPFSATIRAATGTALSGDAILGASSISSSVPVIESPPFEGGRLALLTSQPIRTMLLLIWAVEFVACVTFEVASAIMYYRRFLREARLLGNVRETCLCAGHRFGREVRLYEAPDIPVPITLGVLRPVIVVPASFLSLSQQQRALIIEHEMAHVERFDVVRKASVCLVVSLHWFNPLAWIMRSVIERDIELACDERAMRGLGADDRRVYAHLLLDTAEMRAWTMWGTASFGTSSLRERILAITRPRRWSATPAAATSAFLCSVLIALSIV